MKDWSFKGWPTGIKYNNTAKPVTATGLPAGLKLAQDKTTKAWSIAGTPTKAGNFVVTFKTVRNGVTVTERVAIVVTANAWTGSWYGVQAAGGDADASLTGDADASLLAEVTVSANGTTATLVLPKDKKDGNDGKDRTCVVDFENGELKVDGAVTMRLFETDTEATWPDVLTVVMEETAGGETNAYGYVTATYNAKKGEPAQVCPVWTE